MMGQMLDVLLLMALGIGYIVIYFAQREDKILQITGYIIGIAIVSFSTFYIVTNFLFQSRLLEPRMPGYQGMMRHRAMMPPVRLPPQR
jgi:hypothetical protein